MKIDVTKRGDIWTATLRETNGTLIATRHGETSEIARGKITNVKKMEEKKRKRAAKKAAK